MASNSWRSRMARSPPPHRASSWLREEYEYGCANSCGECTDLQYEHFCAPSTPGAFRCRPPEAPQRGLQSYRLVILAPGPALKTSFSPTSAAGPRPGWPIHGMRSLVGQQTRAILDSGIPSSRSWRSSPLLRRSKAMPLWFDLNHGFLLAFGDSFKRDILCRA